MIRRRPEVAAVLDRQSCRSSQSASRCASKREAEHREDQRDDGGEGGRPQDLHVQRVACRASRCPTSRARIGRRGRAAAWSRSFMAPSVGSAGEAAPSGRDRSTAGTTNRRADGAGRRARCRPVESPANHHARYRRPMQVTASIFKAYDIRGIVPSTLDDGLRRAPRPRLRQRGARGRARRRWRWAATAASRARAWSPR